MSSIWYISAVSGLIFLHSPESAFGQNCNVYTQIPNDDGSFTYLTSDQCSLEDIRSSCNGNFRYIDGGFECLNSNSESHQSPEENILDVIRRSKRKEGEYCPIGSTDPFCNGGSADEEDLRRISEETKTLQRQLQNTPSTASRVGQQIITELTTLQEQFATCQADSERAVKCCENPEQCIGQTVGMSDEGSSAATKTMGFITQLVASMPTSSISSMCGRGKDIGNFMTAINAGMASTCNRAKNACTRSCSNIADRAKSLRNRCAADTSGPLSCRNTDFDAISKITAEMSYAVDECKSLGNYARQMTQQAVSSQLAAKYFEMCKSMAQNEEAPENPFDTDCSTPANMATPFCQFQCNRPEFANSPQCVAVNPPQNANPPSQGINPEDLFGNLGFPDNENQEPQFGGATGEGNSVAKPESGAGGMSGLPGAPASGGAGAVAESGRGSAGYDTSIEKGTRSGNGYSVNSMGIRNGSGGFSGYGRAPASVKDQGAPFNLKDFLPGGRKDQKRSLASLAKNLNPEIAPAHADIFQKVSNRFYEICLEDRLLDCSELKIKGKGGR